MSTFAKIILWAVITIALASGTYLAYQYFFGVQPQGIIPPGGTASVSGFKTVASGPVFDYWIHKPSATVYYLTTDGQMHRLTASSTTESLDSKATGNVSYLKPSFDGSLVMVGFGYPQRPTLAIFNPGTKAWTALPAGTIAAAWDPASNNRLIYLKDNGTANQLYYFTLMDKKSKLIAGFAGKDLDLNWTFADLLYLTQRPSAQVPSSAWSYNLKTGAVQSIAREESGLAIKWNGPDKSGLRWSFGQLSLIDQSNKTLGNISLKTIPSKCAFSDIKIYCAAPSGQDGIAASDLSDNYLKGAVSFTDNIYLIYKDSYKAGPAMPALIGYTRLGADLDHLEVWNNGLIFMGRKDHKLYSLSL